MENYFIELVNGEMLFPIKDKVHFYFIYPNNARSSSVVNLKHAIDNFYNDGCAGIGLTTSYNSYNNIYRTIPKDKIISIGLIDKNFLREYKIKNILHEDR